MRAHYLFIIVALIVGYVAARYFPGIGQKIGLP